MTHAHEQSYKVPRTSAVSNGPGGRRRQTWAGPRTTETVNRFGRPPEKESYVASPLAARRALMSTRMKHTFSSFPPGSLGRPGHLAAMICQDSTTGEPTGAGALSRPRFFLFLLETGRERAANRQLCATLEQPLVSGRPGTHAVKRLPAQYVGAPQSWLAAAGATGRAAAGRRLTDRSATRPSRDFVSLGRPGSDGRPSLDRVSAVAQFYIITEARIPAAGQSARPTRAIHVR